ncbi:hypothetical protein [Thalassotalea sp. ND16A]|uniref:hypothetical protein n=1 Tax=Thalassotalea sp. ND16A TaxID=1535422 RepID=UPI00051A5A54|nr:hypothetical protein [Thalassotalea sp. ND16A]KGJ93500.1 hypothetical protein ND16A_1475 [Thalassotalea sp. ND16A]
MAEDKSDNLKLRNNYALTDSFVVKSHQIDINYLKDNNISINYISPADSANTSEHITANNDPENAHSMWWLNTRRRCHKHTNVKRKLARRKH